MSIDGKLRKKGPDASIALWVVVALLAITHGAVAQTVIYPPQPIEYTYPSAPLPNPNLIPPLPVGPAPYPATYNQTVNAWPAYPEPVTPFAPYWGGFPSPATGAFPPYSQTLPMTVEKRLMATYPTAATPPPLPIGNVRLTFSEGFLNRVVARDEQKPGEVRDFILGADVTGHQTTTTNVRLDLVSCAEKLHGVFVLTGKTDSQTTGVTSQAMVNVASQQQFIAYKDVYFDGMSFSTRHAQMHVQAQNQTLGATTPLSGTLFGGIADRIAYGVAERRRPAAEAVARDRVAERVYPEFDGEVDRNLAVANDQLENFVRRKLRELNMMPTQQQVTSTDTYADCSAQLGPESPGTTSLAVERFVNKDDGLCLFVHETFLHLLIANSGMKGLKTTDKEIKAIFAPYEYKTADDGAAKKELSIPLPGMDNIVTNVEFDETDPLQLKIENGRTLVILRASFKPGGQELLPPLVVTIPYEIELISDKVITVPGKVTVARQDQSDGASEETLAIKLVRQGIESKLSKLAFDRTLPAGSWPLPGAAPQLNSINSDDGWIAVSVK